MGCENVKWRRSNKDRNETSGSIATVEYLLHVDYCSESWNMLVIRVKNDDVGGSCSMHSRE
jgi:hypothetical protein